SPRLPAPRKSGKPASRSSRARAADARLPDQNRTASGHRSQIGNSVGGGHSKEIETTGNAACSSVPWIHRIRCFHPGGGSGSGIFLSGQDSILPSKRKSRRSDRRSRRVAIRFRAGTAEPTEIECVASNRSWKPKRVAWRRRNQDIEGVSAGNGYYSRDCEYCRANRFSLPATRTGTTGGRIK